VRAFLGHDGVAQVRTNAATAFALDRPDSPYRGIARYLEGSALRLMGEAALARHLLEDGLALTTVAAPAVQTQCLGQLALLSIDEDDWSDAEHLIRSAMQVIDEYALHDRPEMAIQFAMAAVVAARQSDSSPALRAHDHAVSLLGELRGSAPWFIGQTQLVLARASLLVGQREKAHSLLNDARRSVSRCPDATKLQDQLADATRMIDDAHLAGGLGATALTPAELRVLRFLPTQLTFGELGTQLFISHHTVKTHVHSVYRKLGVSSRTSAVEMARCVGLIDR
jgi:LuxR family transcriptional regulator, maltose regulon positive regulatory protein